MVTSLTYVQAVQQLPHHFTLSFLRELYQYARTNLPEKEVIECFLILTPDLLLGANPEQLSVSMDDLTSSQQGVVQPPSDQLPATSTPTLQSPPAQLGPNVSLLPPMSLPPPTIQGGNVIFSAGVPAQGQFQPVVASTTYQSLLPPANTISYASVASLPQAIAGEQVSLFSASTPGPHPTPGQPNNDSGSPTYATLVPVQTSPPNLATGSFLPTVASTEPSNEDSLSKRNRHRFVAQKSAPYPPQN
jgi:hypothetical protein